jgi:TRAP-type uncharacterized transport system fused permease subunit
MKPTTEIEQELEEASKAVVAQEEEKNRQPRGFTAISVIAICFSVFQLVTGYFHRHVPADIHVIFGFT